MSLISVSKLQNIIPEFVDAKLIPSAPSKVKWFLGGATYLVIGKAEELVQNNAQVLKTLGILNDNNQLDIDKIKGFLNSAFNKSSKVEMYGFTFDSSDGEFLTNLLEKYKDD